MTYEARDFFKRPLTEVELRELTARAGGAKALFSWRSPSAKPLHLNEATVSDDDLVALMLKEPRLIRRPLVSTPPALLVQPDPGTLQASFAEG